MFKHLRINFCFWSKRRPNRNDNMKIHLMKFIAHFFRLGKKYFVEKHSAPVSCTIPVIPILYHIVDRYFKPAIFFSNIHKLSLGVVMFFALPVTVSPFTVHRGFACKLTVAGNNFIHIFSAHQIVINVIPHIRPD